MKYNSSNKPLVCMQTSNACYKGTTKMVIKGILWHSTGANNPTLKRYVQPSDDAPDKDKMIAKIGKNNYGNDWNHSDKKAGMNAWIGKLADGTVASIQTMPWDYAPWGCGSGTKGSCNSTHIQFEICEDSLSDKSYFEKVYKEACELTAYLCKTYNIDPKGTFVYNGVTVPTILCHKDSYRLGLGSNHSDIYHWFNKYGKDMNTVRNDVYALMNKAPAKCNGKVDGYNIVRGSDCLVIYNKGSNTGTNMWGTEVSVNSDGVASCAPVYGKGKMTIPSGGYVISGHGIASKWILENIKKGSKITIEKDIVKVGAVVSTTKTQKSLDAWAKEVINGKHGNGHSNREASLKRAGCTYTYAQVRARVNALLK